MKIYTAKQIRAADKYTIENLPISSIDLMERAASAFVNKFTQLFNPNKSITILCGIGNNGGDGLAIARILANLDWNVNVVVYHFSKRPSVDFKENLLRLQQTDVAIKEVLSSREAQPKLSGDILIDALFGTGLNRLLNEWPKDVVELVNSMGKTVVAVDIPSGLFSTFNSIDVVAVRASHTISFEWPKLCFLDEDFMEYVGDFAIVSIGIHPDFQEDTPYYLFASNMAGSHVNNRIGGVHKGTFGCVGVVAGSAHSMGAAILAAKAAYRAGAGLVVVNTLSTFFNVFYANVPEVMMADGGTGKYIDKLNLPQKVSVVLIGPGMGITVTTTQILKDLILNTQKLLVIDADALTILAQHKEWWPKLKGRAILTPHVGEWKRFGMQLNGFENTLNEVRSFTKQYGCVVVLKGPYSKVVHPDGCVFFNSTGNAGLATAGSGDVLSGIIAAHFAVKEAKYAANMGAFLHGLSADLCVQDRNSHQSLMASDVIDYIGRAYKSLRKELQ